VSCRYAAASGGRVPANERSSPWKYRRCSSTTSPSLHTSPPFPSSQFCTPYIRSPTKAAVPIGEQAKDYTAQQQGSTISHLSSRHHDSPTTSAAPFHNASTETLRRASSPASDREIATHELKSDFRVGVAWTAEARRREWRIGGCERGSEMTGIRARCALATTGRRRCARSSKSGALLRVPCGAGDGGVVREVGCAG